MLISPVLARVNFSCWVTNYDRIYFQILVSHDIYPLIIQTNGFQYSDWPNWRLIKHLSLASSMLFSPALSLLSSQLPKDVHSPAEGVIVSRVAVQLVKGLKFCVGNDEIYEKMSLM